MPTLQFDCTGNRQTRGELAYLAGIAAEESVERYYHRSGFETLAKRWRGQIGEIDLIFRGRGFIVFVEVKKSKSYGAAIAALGPHQMRRITATAEEFLGTQPKGQLTPMQIDVAAVMATGEIHVIENAFCDF